ncbi:MAG: OmpA family protein, partial [Actinotalea sp.]|nr:OmpA family protein [Actinotalea sp.]
MPAAVMLLAACTAGGSVEATPAPTAPAPVASGDPDPEPEPEPQVQAAVAVDADVRGNPARIEVGPVVVDGDLAVLRTAVTATGDESVSPNDLGFVFFDTGRLRSDNLRLIDTRELTVAPVVPNGDGRRVVEQASVARPGGEASVFHSAHAAPSGPTVAVLVPFAGLVEDVPVVAADDPAADGVPTVAQIVDAEGISGEGLVVGAAPLESYRVLEEGLVRTSEIGEAVSVAIDADVLFDFNSADLTAEADAALVTAAGEIVGAEGELLVVGHTDDQGQEQLNQQLSQARAASVADRLATLVDLSGLEVVQEGRGQREPAVEGTSEEARAANRRVELVVTRPPETVEREAAPRGEVPPARGPVGSATDGVLVERDGGTGVRVRVESVRLVDRVLVGTL